MGKRFARDLLGAATELFAEVDRLGVHAEHTLRVAALDDLETSFTKEVAAYFVTQGALFVKAVTPLLANLWPITEGMPEGADWHEYNPHLARLWESENEDTDPPGWLQIAETLQRAQDETASTLETAVQKNAATALGKGAQATLASLDVNVTWYLNNPRANAYLVSVGANLVTNVDATTKNRVRQITLDGLKDHKSYSEIARDYVDAYEQDFAGGILPGGKRVAVQPQGHLASRAQLIAVTELANAYCEGQYATAERLQRQGIELEKSWSTIGDSRVSEGCKQNAAAGWIGFDTLYPNQYHTYNRLRPPRFPGCRCDQLIRRKPLAVKVPKAKPAKASAAKGGTQKRDTYPPGSLKNTPYHDFTKYEHIQQWVEENYPNMTFSLTQCDLKLVNELTGTFAQLAADYPEVAAKLKYFGDLDESRPGYLPPASELGVWRDPRYSNTYAYALNKGTVIAFNPKYFGDADVLKQYLANDVNTGWHPKGTGTAAGVLTHEWGHQVDNWLVSLPPGTQFTKYVSGDDFGLVRETYMQWLWKHYPAKDPPSRYAVNGANPEAEHFAEAFASMHLTPLAEQAGYTKELSVLLSAFDRKNLTQQQREDVKWLKDLPVGSEEWTIEFNALIKLKRSLGL